MTTNCRMHWVSVLWILVSLLAMVGTALADGKGDDSENKKARTLYVWAGDQARLAPDFLAVIDFDEESKDYGKVSELFPFHPPGT